MLIKNIEVARSTVKSIITDYKKFINETDDIKQSLTSNYQNVIVQGGYHNGQAVANQILDKADKDTYINSVEDILRVMPSTYRNIIIERYIRKTKHDDIIEKLGGIDEDKEIARTTYYRWYDNAVMVFYRETLARMIEIKVGNK